MIKHAIKRTSIFLAFFLLLSLIFYIKYLFTKDGSEIFEYAFCIVFFLFFSAMFLLFEASSLKELKKLKDRKFNLIAAGMLFLFLFFIILKVMIGIAYTD